jgi:hypothetical protein
MFKRICLILTVLILYSTLAFAAEGAAAAAQAGPDGAVMPAKADFTDLRLTNVLTVRRVLDPLRMSTCRAWTRTIRAISPWRRPPS